MSTWRRPFLLGDTQIRFVVAPMGFGVRTLTREGVPINVTDRERTLVDGCDRSRYSGGLEEFPALGGQLALGRSPPRVGPGAAIRGHLRAGLPQMLGAREWGVLVPRTLEANVGKG